MSDLIRIVDLEVFSHIGVPEMERHAAQGLLVSVEMACETIVHAANTDDLDHTINYANVAERIRRLAAQRERKLIETLAEEIAADILGAFPIKKIRVEIKKLVLPDARYVSVEIERTRE